MLYSDQHTQFSKLYVHFKIPYILGTSVVIVLTLQRSKKVSIRPQVLKTCFFHYLLDHLILHLELHNELRRWGDLPPREGAQTRPFLTYARKP